MDIFTEFSGEIVSRVVDSDPILYLYRVLLSFTEFYRVLPSFTDSFTEFHRVFTEFYRFLPTLLPTFNELYRLQRQMTLHDLSRI